MEADSHDSVGVIKCFLNSISMVNINVEVKHSGVDLQQFQDAQNDIIDIAKPAGLSFFGMVEPARPVNDDITFSCYDQIRSIDASSCCQLAKVKKSFKAWTVKSLVDFKDGSQLDILSNFGPLLLLLGRVLLDNRVWLGTDPGFKILDVEWMMEVV